MFWTFGHLRKAEVKMQGEDRSMAEDQPLIPLIIDFVEFLKRENPTFDQMCQFSVIRTFGFLKATSMFGAKLEPTGTIRPIGQFGFSKEVMKSWESSHVDEDIPTGDALKTNNIIWLADKDQWLRDYPHLAKYSLEMTANTFIAWPISVRGAYMSVLGICLESNLKPTPDLISLFETIGGLIALQLSKSTESASDPESDRISALINFFTRRQRDVLTLVSDGLTNPQIAKELGFSESTIRQETMRIYEILGASGRADAIKLFRSIGIK